MNLFLEPAPARMPADYFPFYKQTVTADTMNIQTMLFYFYRVLIFVAAAGIFPAGYSQPLRISAEQSGAFDSADYIVEEDMIVPEQKTLTFLPGTRLFFNPFAGLKVSGTLICEGTKERPIIFSTLQDTGEASSGELLLWNGINVDNKGSLSFVYCEIRNASYGVKVPDTMSLQRFEKVNFQGNDNQLVINGVPAFSDDTVRFTFPVAKRKAADGSSGGIQRRSPLLTLLQFTFLTCAVGSAVGCIYFSSKADYYDGKYDKAGVGTTPEEFETIKDQRQKYKSMYNTALAGSIISGSAFGIALTVNIITTRKN